MLKKLPAIFGKSQVLDIFPFQWARTNPQRSSVTWLTPSDNTYKAHIEPRHLVSTPHS